MNTFWVRIVTLGVVVLGLVILVNVFSSSEPKPEPKTIYDVWDEDDKRMQAPPGTEEQDDPATTAEPDNSATVKPVKPVEPPLQFKELSLEDEIQAQKLFEMVRFSRKSGRIPVMTQKRTVDYCREIIEKWPESEYAYKARRELRSLPQRILDMYNVTDEEMGR